jgi:hypothetical protein
MEKSHIGDVVDVYLCFEHDNKSLAVHLDGKDRGGEKEFTDHGLTLRRYVRERYFGVGIVDTYFRVDYLQFPGG